jgi:hypothetical protein
MINVGFFIFLMAVIAGFYLKDWQNPLYRAAVKPVAEDGLLEEAQRVNPQKQITKCTLNDSVDLGCVEQGSHHPIYIWGAPTAPHPRVATAEQCKASCEKFGPGMCVWRENGPDYNGGTSCYFVSNQVCGPSGMKSAPFTDFYPSQVKVIQSGKCE